MRWVERYEDEDSIKRHNREHISYKVKKEHVEFALDEIKKNKTITIDIIEKNINIIEWYSLTKNPAIYELNYAEIAKQLTHVLEEGITSYQNTILVNLL